MHRPRVRRHANHRPRCASAPVAQAPDDHYGNPAWADAVAHLLLPNEVAHIKADALGWRWESSDVTYDRNLLLLGGPVGMAVTGMASAVANRRARRSAERVAAPAWRPLGPLVVIATDRRLLVWHKEAWWSVWYSAIVGVQRNAAESQIDLFFGTDAPYRLRSVDSHELLDLFGGAHHGLG